MPKKVVLGLSGGMDSAYAALKLKERGFEVVGVHLLMKKGVGAAKSAQALASRLGIEFCAVDATGDFARDVAAPFSKAYVSGLTPNPCVLCNACVKFPRLCEAAAALGAEAVATGHYTSPVRANGRYTLAPAKDARKDQGYFLYGLSQAVLSRFIAPLGGVLKDEVRRCFGDDAAFPASCREESKDLCFAGEGGYAEAVASYSPLPPPGDFTDESGRVLGRHRGIHNYTIGQRKGLGIALGAPAYVSAIDPVRNTVTLATGAFCVPGSFEVSRLRFLSAPEIESGRRFKVRTRYGARLLDCVVEAEGGDPVRDPVRDHICDPVRDPVRDRVRVSFCGDRCIAAPGQAAVFYDENGCIAFGGEICRRAL